VTILVLAWFQVPQPAEAESPDKRAGTAAKKAKDAKGDFRTEIGRSCVRQNAGFPGIRPHSGECSYGFETASSEKKGSDEKIDPLSVNATCYVCHMTFVREKISKTHFKAKVTCVKCHGLSAGHANDEDVGATKPDIVYKRHQVDAMCSECHEDHDVPAKEVIGRFIERKPTERPVVCTDCHGTHKIKPQEEKEGPSRRPRPGLPG